MIGAQSVLRYTNTSPETTTPLADSSIHDLLVKACPLVDQTRFKFVDVSYSGWVNFLLHKLQMLKSTGFRSGEFCDHSVGEIKSGTLRSRKATVSRARWASAPSVLLKNKPSPGISGICLAVASCQEDCRDSMFYSL